MQDERWDGSRAVSEAACLQRPRGDPAGVSQLSRPSRQRPGGSVSPGLLSSTRTHLRSHGWNEPQGSLPLYSAENQNRGVLGGGPSVRWSGGGPQTPVSPGSWRAAFPTQASAARSQGGGSSGQPLGRGLLRTLSACTWPLPGKGPGLCQVGGLHTPIQCLPHSPSHPAPPPTPPPPSPSP